MYLYLDLWHYVPESSLEREGIPTGRERKSASSIRYQGQALIPPTSRLQDYFTLFGVSQLGFDLQVDCAYLIFEHEQIELFMTIPARDQL